MIGSKCPTSTPPARTHRAAFRSMRLRIALWSPALSARSTIERSAASKRPVGSATTSRGSLVLSCSSVMSSRKLT